MTTLDRNRVDLHCHSRRSDGALEPLALWQEMVGWGLHIAALTDHDTLQGYRELRAAGLGAGGSDHGSATGPRLIPGIEINTLGSVTELGEGLGRVDGELHILGFGVDPDDAALDAALARQRDARRIRIDLTLERLRAIGVDVSAPFASLALTDDAARGRPHVAEALVLAGHATSVNDAFDRWLSWGRPGYVPRQGMGPRDAIESIVAAGGIAVLAHAPDAPDHPRMIDRLQDWGLTGIEVYYRSFDAITVDRMARFATMRGLLPTGGSDFHGQDHGYRETQALTHVPERIGEGLLQALEALGAGDAHRAAPTPETPT